MSIITYPLDNITYDATDAETYLCTRTSGVYSADNCFALTVPQSGTTVTVGKGLAWIKNADFAGKSICNTEAVSVALPAANSSLPRIDRVVLRFSTSANQSEITYIQGVAASAPTAPARTWASPTYELVLYDIYRPAGSTRITADNVTDKRLDESVCGLMRDGVTGIPTAELYAQAQELILSLRAEIAAIEDQTGVMLKSVYDPEERNGRVAFEPDIIYDGPATNSTDIDLANPDGEEGSYIDVDLSGYDYLEVLFRDNDMNYGSVKVADPEGKNMVLSVSVPRFGSSSTPRMNIKARKIHLENGHITTTSDDDYVEITGIGSSAVTGANSNNIYIYKVIGWRMTERAD